MGLASRTWGVKCDKFCYRICITILSCWKWWTWSHREVWYWMISPESHVNLVCEGNTDGVIILVSWNLSCTRCWPGALKSTNALLPGETQGWRDESKGWISTITAIPWYIGCIRKSNRIVIMGNVYCTRTVEYGPVQQARKVALNC